MNRIKTALELQVKFKQWITYRTRRSLPAVLFIGVFIFLGLSMITDMSGTTDEKYHLTRGIMYLNTGDPRINQHHPMLFNTYYAIPTLFDDDLVIPSETDPLWVNAQKDSISDELVKMNGGKVLFSQNVLFGPRALAIMTSAFLLYVIFRLVERSYGYKISYTIGIPIIKPYSHCSFGTCDNRRPRNVYDLYFNTCFSRVDKRFSK